MAVANLLLKYFSQFQGLDLRSSDLSRLPQFCSEMKNAEYNDSNAITKRRGFQYKTPNSGGYGMSVYKDINTTTGAVTETVVTVDDDLFTLTSDSFNITYSGAGTALLDVVLDTATNTYNIIILEDTVEVFNQDVGIGFDEASTTAISTIITNINALTDFAASGGTVTTDPAAFLDLHNSTVLTSTATAINYKRWAAANTPTTNPLATFLGNKNNDDFENASFANLNNILYVSTSYDELHKYDGQTFYRAGMPEASTAITTAEDAAGSTFSTGEAYYYKYLYKQVDNKGNIIEGILSPASGQETIAAASADIDVTVTNITSSSGFNTNCAIVNGVQAGVTTITVDSGHTLNSGDTAYFYDGNTSAYVTKTITSTTATSITFSGSVDVADNAVISNNLRIAIYRTNDAGSSDGIYSLVAEIPNDSIGTATQVYTDQITDANLGAEFVEPIKAHGLPPKGRYLTTFRNQLFIAGDPENVNTCYYSDIDNPEYFPAGQNSFLVDAFPGNKIRGLSALDTAVIVFKDKSVQSITGDIGQDNFRVDEISYGGIGCVSHDSIQSIRGSLFFLSKKGVFAANIQGITEVGSRIKSEFTKFDVAFNFQKATSTNWVSRDKYVLFMPSESQDGSSNDYADANSACYAYDYVRDAWLKWTNVNAQGGFALLEDSTLYFTSRRLDSNDADVQRPTAVFNNYGDFRDYNDHHNSTEFEYKTHWESLEDPAVFKKFLRLKVFSLPSDLLDGDTNSGDLTVETEFNYNTPAVTSSFTMDFTGGTLGYGNSAWGTFPWGDASLPELKGKLKTQKVRALRLIFKNDNESQNVLISGYELEIAAAFARMMKE